MIRHVRQIGGVTVTFAMGHVNELRGESPVIAHGERLDRLSPNDWLASTLPKRLACEHSILRA